MDLAQITALASRQQGAFTHAQVIEHGGSHADIDRWLQRGSIERVHPAVYRFVGYPITWLNRLSAATLSIPGSVASHRSAAALWDLRGFDRAPIEVLVVRWSRRVRAPAGVIVHETKDLRAIDRTTLHGVATTTVVRTLVDLPAVVLTHKAGDALDHATRRDASMLRRVHARHLELARRGRPGTAALRTLLAERMDGDLVDSGFERRALQMITAAGLPPPTTQHKVVLPGIGPVYLDLAWAPILVAMECDSYEFHSDRRSFVWDRKRRRSLIELGWTVLEATYDEVRHHDRQLLAQLTTLLAPARPAEPA